MSHHEQLAFVSLISRTQPDWSGKRILEIGSYDVNGSIRRLFSSCKDYIGVDLTAGPGVDVVSSGHELTFDDAAFDLTISCECFEHNPYWRETFANMIRMTKPGGLTVLTCASRGRLEHGTARTDSSVSPGTSAVGIDYYMNLRQRDFVRNFALSDLFHDHRFFYNSSSRDLYFVARKKPAYASDMDFPQFARDVERLRRSIWGDGLSFRNCYHVLSEYIPLEIMSRLLTEERFQNAALPYMHAKSRLRSLVRGHGLQRTPQ